MKVLGIDIGASGVKGAIVDTEKGEMISERIRLETPQPATPEAVAKTVKELAKQIGWKDGLIGVGFPAIVKKGVAHSAANIDKSWIGTSISKTLSKSTNCPVVAVNDADAAGIAAIKFGAGKGEEGVVFLITLGSGIGSGFFLDGELVPSPDLGQFR
jgi:polyphosphate glucokinase